jgi:hypothetical protein
LTNVLQVGYTIFPQISDRVIGAGYAYAIAHGKDIYATFYTEKVYRKAWKQSK